MALGNYQIHITKACHISHFPNNKNAFALSFTASILVGLSQKWLTTPPGVDIQGSSLPYFRVCTPLSLYLALYLALYLPRITQSPVLAILPPFSI